VRVDDHGRARPVFHPLDVLRWRLLPVDAATAATAEDALDLAASALRGLAEAEPDMPLAVRVEIAGRSPAHNTLLADTPRWTGEVRARAADIAPGRLWVEKVAFLTAPPLAALAGDDPVSELLAIVDGLAADPARREQPLAALLPLWQRLPGELKENDPVINPADPAWLDAMLQRIQPLLRDRLLEAAPNEAGQ